jgi:VIT1/CCC1 family predicted Fe2+/Mn2+ transporter
MHGRTGLLRSQTKSGGWRKWKIILEVQKAEVRVFYAKRTKRPEIPPNLTEFPTRGKTVLRLIEGGSMPHPVSSTLAEFFETSYARICFLFFLFGGTMIVSECFLSEPLYTTNYFVSWGLAVMVTGVLGFTSSLVTRYLRFDIFRTTPRKEVSHVQSCSNQDRS